MTDARSPHVLRRQLPRRAGWVLLLLAGLLLTGIVLDGCAAPGTSSGGGTARCSIQIHNPHESHGSPGNIAAKADIRCRPRVDRVTIAAKLQARVGTDWVDVTRALPNEAARPKPGQRITVTVSMPCRGGTFRTAARGYGYLNGVRSQSVTWTYSGSVKNPCK